MDGSAHTHDAGVAEPVEGGLDLQPVRARRPDRDVPQPAARALHAGEGITATVAENQFEQAAPLQVKQVQPSILVAQHQ